MTFRPPFLALITALALSLALCPAAIAAEPATTPVDDTPGVEPNAGSLPDAPVISRLQEQISAAPSDVQNSVPPAKAADGGVQTKRILYIIPNFRAVSADQHLPPQTVKEKFNTAALDSVDDLSFIFVGIQSGIAQARNSNFEFRQGAASYGRYYWHTYADYADENLWVEG